MQLNRNAVDNFNKKAEALLESLNSEPMPSKPVAKNKSIPIDVHITATIKPIGEVKISRSDPQGNEIGKEFHHKGRTISITGKAYDQLRQIATGIQKTTDFRNAVSLKLLIELVFEWIKQKYRRKTGSLLIDYVIKQCQLRIKDYEIWIPIACTRVESEFKFGNITLKTITREMLDQYEADIRKGIKENGPKFDSFFDKERTELLGFAAASLKIRAEPARAYEIAAKEAENSLGLLRCLHPFNCLTFYVSYSVPLGREGLKFYRYFLTQNNKIVGTSSGVDRNALSEWRISNSDVLRMKSHGLEILDNLLKTPNRTRFQNDIFNNLLLYSQSSLKNDLADKLTYILTPLEALLLVDTAQSTQDLAERMVMLVENDLDGRKEALEIIMSVYDLKLNFVYGEQKIQDLKRLEKFMCIAWTFFINLLPHSDKFETKNEFINAIDNKKLSGGLV